MTKLEAYRFLSAHDRGTSFVANVVITRGVNPAKRLKTMVRLIQDGRELGAGLDTEHLSIDGRIRTLRDLDTM